MSADPFAVGAAWLGTYLIHSSLLLGAMWGAARLGPRAAAHDRRREIGWRVALLAPVVSASLQLALDRPIGTSIALPGDGGTAGGTAAPSWLGERWPAMFVIVWATVAVARVVALLLAHRRFVRRLAGRRALGADERRRAWPPGERSHPPRLTAFDGLASPLALRGEICLPERALRELDDEPLRRVVAHELAHLRRRDPAWRWTAALIERALFVQPLNRVAVAELRDVAECLCDDAAAADGGAVPLAEALLAAARWLHADGAQRPASPGLVPAMASTESSALRRVRRVLGAERRGRQEEPARAVRVALALGVCAAATLLAPGVRTAASAAARAIRHEIHATDPAGAFTLSIEGGRVLGATIDGRVLAADRLRQRGDTLVLMGDDGQPFAIRLRPNGISWSPRPPRAPGAPPATVSR